MYLVLNETSFNLVRPDVFFKVINEAKILRPLISDNVTAYDERDYTYMRCYLNHSGTAGYCITQSGELVSVFSVFKGLGDNIIKDAISRGAKRLDCFEGYLSDFYKKHGFKIKKRVKNWDGYQHPDVCYLFLESCTDSYIKFYI